MQPFYIETDNGRIYAELFLPQQGGGPYPYVILSHGFGMTHARNTLYAQSFSDAGIAAVTFDFCGGGPETRSSGTMLETSVLTQTEDLIAVMDWAREQPDLDDTRLFLFGGSQGGYVSTCAAGRLPERVKAMVLLYPGYVLQDAVREARGVPEEMLPETFDVLGRTVGRRFITDLIKTDIWQLQERYHGEVLILHGDRDEVVPLSYSREALRHFSNAQLVIYEGAEHGFLNGFEPRCAQEVTGWLLQRT